MSSGRKSESTMATRQGAPPRRAPGSLSRLGEVPEVVEPNNNNDCDNNNNDVFNSGNTTTQEKPGASSRLPSIRERRPSVQKKARASSFNDALNDNTASQRRDPSTTTTTNTTTTTTTTVTRRASVPQGTGSSSLLLRRGSKPTFAGIGRRVSSMVKCRNAFQNRIKSITPDKEEENHMEVIHELPRNPRFSTFLSAEAQYAMMKGYEDKLYEKIVHFNPESRLSLKRNKTPHHKKIAIVDVDSPSSPTFGKADAESVDGSVTPENKSVSSSRTSGYGSVGSTPSATATSSFSTADSPTSDVSRSMDSRSLSPESTTSSTVALPSPFLKPLRRLSIATTSDVSGRGVTSPMMTSPRQGTTGGWTLHRSNSLPTLDTGLSHNKRLVLTYRLESAMDILDTIKRRNKENSLSPRVCRVSRKMDTVKDFNSWTRVWNKEFKEVHAK